MDSELFHRNLNYIKSRSSSISYNVLLNSPDETGKLSVEYSGQGKPLFYAHSDNGKAILHSARDPENEAERQIKAWDESSPVDWNSSVIVFGFAGMHHVLKIHEKLGAYSNLIVIDCIPEVFRKALHYCDLGLFENKPANIVFIISEDPDSAARELRHYLKGMLYLKAALFTHPGLFRSFGNLYKVLYERSVEEIRTEIVDRSTRALMSDEWIQNSVLNLPAILRTSSVSVFKDIFKGRTALMLAAGPSLSDSFEYIKKAADKYVIFAVGTALRPLLKAGIEPDFIVVIDCDPIVMKQFNDLQIPEKSIVLASTIVYSELLNNFSMDRLAFFDIGVPKGFNEWLSGMDAALETLAAGGTVSLSAIDAAVYCGCDKIIFCGLDLAFLDDGTTHACNSMYDGQKAEKETFVKVKGNFGRDVLTSKQFSIYISMMDSYLESTLNRNDIKFYNVATGGALLRNTSVISPADMLNVDNYTEIVDKSDLLVSKLKKAEGPAEQKVFGFIAKTMSELKEICDIAEKAEKAADIIFNSEESVKYSSMLAAELEKLDRKIRSKTNAASLVSSALQPLFINIFLSDNNDSKNENAREKNKRFYEHIKGAADWLYGLFDIAVKAYKNKHNLKIRSVKS